MTRPWYFQKYWRCFCTDHFAKRELENTAMVLMDETNKSNLPYLRPLVEVN